MLSTKYSEAAVEVLDILNHMEKEDYNKVPKKFINMLEESASKDYVCELDYSKRLIEMDLSEETKALLGVMFRNYWCPEERRQAYENKLSENEAKLQAELRDKYNPDNIFETSSTSTKEENTSTNSSIEESTSETITEIGMIEVEEKSIFKRILNKIISIFKK